MKPRHGARVDRPQPHIVQALRERGAVVLVLDLAQTWNAKGEPDLLVGFLGRLTLLETKAAKGKLAEHQQAKHAAWARVGVQVHVVRDETEALAACGMDAAGLAARQRDLGTLAAELDRAKTLTVGKARLMPSVKRYTQEGCP